MKIKLFFLSLLLLISVRAQAQSETLRVWLDSNVTLTADSTSVAYLTLYENDGAQGYTSFNMSLIVPKGIHVNKVQQGRDLLNDISLSERATATHTIACNMPADTLLTVACTSSTNQDLYTDDAEGNPLDALWTIGLIAEPTMENGDYVRMQNLTVGYDFKQLFKNMPLQQLRLYFTAENLFTITGYSGMDPEVGYGGYESWVTGVDIGSYPSARTYIVGVNIKF